MGATAAGYIVPEILVPRKRLFLTGGRGKNVRPALAVVSSPSGRFCIEALDNNGDLFQAMHLSFGPFLDYYFLPLEIMANSRLLGDQF